MCVDITANTSKQTNPPVSFRHNCFNIFVPTEVFIKDDTQVLKLSNTLYSRPY